MSNDPNPNPDPNADPNPSTGQGDPADGDQSFSQADVDRIVADRLKREREATKAKYADYDDLKKKAEGAKTLEDRIADLEDKGSKSEQRALRAEIAGEFGISTKRAGEGEPSDADLFLTGSDEQTIRAQAERLAGRESERAQRGNHVPGEGAHPQTKSDPKREFLREIQGED